MAQGHQAAELDERMIAVMFTDIVEFTSVAEQKSAAETASFLNQHFHLLTLCIEPEAGTIDKYIGNSLMAFWGAPEPQPDHAARACRARPWRYGRRYQRTMQSGGAAAWHQCACVSASTVVPQSLATSEHRAEINYTIVGDTVNTAQRIGARRQSYGRER